MTGVFLAGSFGLFGVLVGSALGGVLEIWRTTLSARAAARVIRSEIQDNGNKCQLAITFRDGDLELTDRAWHELRVQIGQVVPEHAFLLMNTGYGSMFLIKRRLRTIQSDYARAKAELEDWVIRMMDYSSLLAQIETRSRFAQMADLLLGHQTYPGGKSNPIKERLERPETIGTSADSEMKKAIDETFEGIISKRGS